MLPRQCYGSRMVANGKLPDSYELLVAAFDLNDEVTAEAELADEIDAIDLFMALLTSCTSLKILMLTVDLGYPYTINL